MKYTVGILQSSIFLMISMLVACSGADMEDGRGSTGLPGSGTPGGGAGGGADPGFGPGPGEPGAPGSTPGSPGSGPPPPEFVLIDDCQPGDKDLMAGSGSADGMRFLYPYDGTVFPRGLLAPP